MVIEKNSFIARSDWLLRVVAFLYITLLALSKWAIVSTEPDAAGEALMYCSTFLVFLIPVLILQCILAVRMNFSKKLNDKHRVGYRMALVGMIPGLVITYFFLYLFYHQY